MRLDSDGIAITGGAGFIGGHFRDRLNRLGCRFTTLDLRAPREEYSGERVVLGDVRDPGAVRSALGGCDCVLHLAAAHHDFGIARETFFSVNVGGAETICRVMDELGIRRLCFFSSVAVYGSGVSNPDETAECRPDSAYGESKLAAEEVFHRWAERGGGRSVLIIRPTVTFGPGHFANMYTLVRQIESRLYVAVGSGENRKSLVYVDNIVDATLELWFSREAPGVRVFNAVDKPDLTSRQIAAAVYRTLGRRPPSIRVPFFLASAVTVFLDAIIGATGWNLPISSDRLHKFARAETVYAADKLARAGVEQRVSLEAGIERMVEWYRQTGRDLPLDRSIPPAECRLEGSDVAVR